MLNLKMDVLLELLTETVNEYGKLMGRHIELSWYVIPVATNQSHQVYLEMIIPVRTVAFAQMSHFANLLCFEGCIFLNEFPCEC